MESPGYQDWPEPALKLIQRQNTKIESQEKKLESQEQEIERLKDELRLALYRKFGRSSEKSDPSQIELFEVPESTDESEESLEETITIPSHARKKAGRKPLDESIPREEIIHDIPEEEKQCGCGYELVKIGEEISEKLQIIPEQVFVERHIYPKYACRHCEGSGDEDKPVFRKASTVPSLISGSILTPGLMAIILVNKFCDHLPFYRQEKRFERIGVHISRQDMSNWTNKVYLMLQFLEELLKRKIKDGPVIQMDETPVQVLNEKDRSNTAESRMWLARGGPPKNPVIFYQYHSFRNAGYVKDLLEGYSGFLQTDGYQGYDSALKGNSQIIHVGCLAHARRKFVDAAKASKKAGSAQVAVSKIRKIYRIEEELRSKDLSDADFLNQRRTQVKPLLDNLKAWLDDKSAKIRPGSLTGKAVKYTHSQWDKIIRYLDSPYLTPDNNAAERSIKPFVVGRKNWLFSGSPKGARASSLFFSLIETAKANDLNPYGYLKWIFEKVMEMDESFDRETLLPDKAKRDEIQKHVFNGWRN